MLQVAHAAPFCAVPPTVQEPDRGLDAAKYLGLAGARAVQDFASTPPSSSWVYLAFIIASRRGWETQGDRPCFPGARGAPRGRRARSIGLPAHPRNGVEQYLFVPERSPACLMVAVLSWIAMAAVGLHDALCSGPS